MAKQSTGFLGGFSGKLGPAVGYMWNGKWCVRSHQPMVNNPRTEAQVAHRELFKQEVQLAAKMRWAVTKTLTGLAREAGMTSYNLFVKVNQPAFGAVDGALQVDYSQLRLSIGDVAPVELTEMTRTEDNVLTVRYRMGVGGRYDHVYLYAYVPDLGRGYLSAPAYRGDKRIAVALPDAFAGHEAQVYLMVESQDGRWSDSLHCGAINQGESLPRQDGESAGGEAVGQEGLSLGQYNVAERHNTNLAACVIDADNSDNNLTDSRCRTSMS